MQVQNGDSITGFNAEWAKKKSEAEFIKEFEGVKEILPLEDGEKPEDRVGRLKSAYKMIKDGGGAVEKKAAKVYSPMMPGAEEHPQVTIVPNP